MMIAVPVPEPSQPLGTVVVDRVTPTLHGQVRRLRALPGARQERLIADLVRARRTAAARAIAGAAARGHVCCHGAGGIGRLADVPVTDLIKGAFEAIVDVSIRQMEAYAELLRNIAKPVDEFMRDDNEVSGDGSATAAGDDGADGHQPARGDEGDDHRQRRRRPQRGRRRPRP